MEVEMIFVVARHGDYASDDDMSEQGSLQAIALAKTLEEKGLLPEKDWRLKELLLLSSTAPRALQFARVLGGQIGSTACKVKELWSDNTHRCNTKVAMGEINQWVCRHRHKTVIFVTHLEYSVELPEELAAEYCKVSISAPWKEIGYGRAHILNTETGELSEI